MRAYSEFESQGVQLFADGDVNVDELYVAVIMLDKINLDYFASIGGIETWQSKITVFFDRDAKLLMMERKRQHKIGLEKNRTGCCFKIQRIRRG